MTFLDTAGFIPHGMCLAWEPDLVAWTMIGDAVIALAYLLIPLQLVGILLKIQNGERIVLSDQGGIIGLFAAFILSCAATHALHVLTMFEPVYRLSAMVTLVTGGISILTAAVLPWMFSPESQADTEEMRNAATANALLQQDLVLVIAGKASGDEVRAIQLRLEAGAPESAVLHRLFTAAVHTELSARQLAQIEDILAA